MTALGSHRLTALLATLCLIQVAGVFEYWRFYEANLYLPAPFVYDKTDTFMDFFHLMYWAGNDGRYRIWGAVYPPINFLLMKAIKWLLVGSTEFVDGFAIRAYSELARWAVVAMYASVSVWIVTTRSWRALTLGQRALAAIFLFLSPPLLFSLERGNLIVLAAGVLATVVSRPGWARIVAIAVLINIKPYFALLLLAYASSDKLANFIATGALAGLIFIVTGLMLDPDFLLFLANLLSFSQAMPFSGREVLALPSSITAFAYVLDVVFSAGSRAAYFGVNLHQIGSGITFLNYVAIAAAIAVLVAAARQLDERVAIALLVVVISNFSVSVGGYSLLMYPVLLPVFLNMRHRWIYVTIVVAMFLPLDRFVLTTGQIGVQHVFLSNMDVPVTWQLGAGSILRPFLNYVLLLAMTIEVAAELPFNFVRFPLSSKVIEP